MRSKKEIIYEGKNGCKNMDQNNVNRPGKATPRRLLAFLLAACIATTSFVPVTAAQAEEPSSDPIVVSGLAELPGEVREQRVPLGVSLTELNLPDTLEATVYSALQDTEPVLPVEPDKPLDSGTTSEDTETVPPSDKDESMEDTTPPSDNGEDLVPPAPPVDEQPEQEPGASITSISENDVPLAAPPSDIVPDEPEVDVPESEVPEVDVPEPEVPETKTVTIHSVTWESTPSYDENAIGEYLFTAVLPERYVLADGVSLPEIHVTVYASAKVISAWTWNDPDSLINEGALALSGVNTETPIDLDTLISMLPASINATLDTQAVQGSGEVETAPTPVSLEWSSTDFVQGEDGSWPVQGSFVFTAAMQEGYTLAEGVPALEITVQLGGAMLLPADGVFTKLEIRQGSATGDLVVNLLDPASTAGDWKLSVATDYYICAELIKPAGATHVQFRFGNADGTYNGVTFANPPGGTYDPNAPGFASDPFDELTACNYFVDPTYGPQNKTPFMLQDGTMTYQIKNKMDNVRVPFTMGMVIKDEVFTGGKLTDAVSISVGNYADGVFTSSSGTDAIHEITLNMQKKTPTFSRFSSQSNRVPYEAPIGSVGTAVTYYPASLTNSDPNVAYLYDSVEFDLTYPVGAELSVGFNQDATGTTGSSFGTMTVGDAEPVGTDGKMEKKHIVIKNGLKIITNTLTVYTRLDFKDQNKFKPGEIWTMTSSQPVITVRGVQLESFPYSNDEINNTVQFELYAGGEDKTSLTGSTRTVYNHTIDLGTGTPYCVPMGTAILKNTDTGNESPYEKTFEAQYNTGNTAANISKVIVPVGTNANPAITWEGIGADGNVKSGIVTDAKDSLKGYFRPADISGPNLYLLPAEHFGIVSFTSIKAEIGRLPADYNKKGNPAYVTFPYLTCSAYGYFTNAESGLVVRNTFRIYNTDVALQDKTNGDLSAEGIVTSTDFCGMGVAAPALADTKLNNVTLGDQSTINGGEIATLTSKLLPYVVPINVYNPGSPQKGTTGLAVDPVFYLTLPQGITLVEENLRFEQETVDFLSKKSIVPLAHTVENVSYLNTTGDGVTIYKITFPDNTLWGYHGGGGKYTNLQYTIPLRTSKSLATTRYYLNDLISIATQNEMTALMYAENNERITFVKEDVYGLNGGRTLAGVTQNTDGKKMGFTVQQQAEINVYNAVAVTKINGQSVPEQWYSYDASNPNSIAMLGRSSEGRLRLQVSNTSATPGTNFAMVLPLPKNGLDLGDVFMEQTPGFDLSMEYDTTNSDTGYTVKYIKMNGASDSIPAGGVDTLVYTEVPASEANAILVTADRVPNGDDYLYLNFTLSNGTPNAIDIWRPAYSYTVDNTTDRRSASGSYVASAVAGSGISGLVWNDTNRNGRKDANESGISGITVVAKDEQNRILSTATDADGGYKFLAVRESKIALSFLTDSSQSLRFNVQPLADSTTATVSTVIPDANGLQATKILNATGSNMDVNAAMSGFISLEYNGNVGATGNLPKTTEYVAGTIATVAVKPDNLAKIGHRFVEWNTKADGTGTSYQAGNTLAITENVTLYAIWEIASYTVTFNYRGATGGNTEASRIRQHNAVYGTLPTPAKKGYEFKGWTDSAAGTTGNVTAAAKFAAGKDITVYALWMPKAGFAVKYNTNGGNSMVDKSVAWTDKVLSGTPTRTGYDFVEWQHAGTKVLATDTFGDLSASDVSGTSITLDAVWNAKGGYTINYNINGGTPAISAKTVTWTDKNLLPFSNPTKANNAFAGWKLNSTEVTNTHSYGDLALTDTTTSITLDAQWVAVSGNVVFYDTDGGSPVNDKVNVGNNDTNLLPSTAPVKPGHTLDKWVVSNGTTEVTNATKYSELSATATLTLKAVWKEKNYTLKYEPYNGTTIAEKTDAKWNSSSLLPTEPAKAGHIFAGWFFNGGEVGAAATVSSLIPNDDAVNDTLNLQAHWNERSYTVQYNSVGGGNFTPKTNVKYTDDGLLPDTTPTKKGYTFTGWYVGSTKVESNTVCSTLLTDDTGSGVTLVAKWEIKSGFTVKYDTAGGTFAAPKNPVAWTDTGLLPGTPPTKNGYVLTGWTAGRSVVTSATAYSAIAESDQAGTYVTLVAVWGEQSGFTVKYDTGGGTMIANKTVTWNGSVLPGTFPTKEGYTFDGWKHGNNPISDAAKYSELSVQDSIKEITLTAIWTENANYTVKYDTGGGSIVDDKISVKWTDTGLMPRENPTYDENHAFVEWQHNGTKVAVTDSYGSLAVQDINLSITLKAVWTQVSDHTVKYDTGGGTVISDLTGVKAGDKNLLPDTDPQRSGYRFTGWKFSDRAVTNDTVYSSLTTEKTLTLTAQWTEKAYTISYDVAGYGSISKKWTESGLLPGTEPEQNGHTFGGWYYNGIKVETATAVSALIPADDTDTLLLKAHWSKKPDAGAGITGTVVDEDGNPIENAGVRLTQGSATIYGPAITDAQGKYLLSNLSPGIYNLVAEKDRQTVTVIVTITDHSLQQDLVLPTTEKNSVLVVEGADTPAVVIGNLDEIAKNLPMEAGSSSLTVKLTVKKETELTNGKETEHQEIRKTAGTQATILFLDALLTKQIDSSQPINIGSSNNVVLEMVIPFDLTGNENVSVYRYHDNVNTFRQLAAIPTGAFEDQTCYLDESAGLIHIYAKKYSTYAIAYDVKSGGGSHQYYDIFLSAGAGGHIQPNQSKVTVREGDSAGFDFIPDNGYRIADVKVDGSSMGAVNSHLFRDVRANHNLSVSFEKVPVTPENPGVQAPTPPAQPKPPVPEPGTIKRDVLDDLSNERDNAIAALPEALIKEQRQSAIDAINQIYNELEEKIKDAGSTADTAELYNKAKRGFEHIIDAPEKVSPVQGISGSKPFILFSALLALLASICAVLTLRHKRSKKQKAAALVAAIAAVVVFFLTSGWNGIKMVNGWTLLIALLTIIPVWLMFQKLKEKDPQEDQQEAVR